MKLSKWHSRYMAMAKLVSTWSKDPSTKVGAVIVDADNRLVSVGYNGLPQGIEDTDERLNNRELKYKMVVHAEKNAILFAHRSVVACTLYTYPFLPCGPCSSFVIQAGIQQVISIENDNPRWQDDFEITLDNFNEACIDTILAEQKDWV